MAKFDAATAVEELEWDFTKYAGKGRKGVIPEPTEKQLNTFFSELKDMVKELGLADLQDTDTSKLTQTEMLQILSDLPEDVLEKQGALVNEAIGRLCSGAPSAEDISMLPARVKQSFVGWVVGHFSPNNSTGGSNA